MRKRKSLLAFARNTNLQRFANGSPFADEIFIREVAHPGNRIST